MKMLATLLLTATISSSSFGQSAHAIPHYTRSDLKQMIRVAKTANDFERLADYFDQQTKDYQVKIQEEQQEFDRLRALPFHARSYPTQLQTTRDQIEHFKTLSNESSEQATLYHNRASSNGSQTDNGAATIR